MLDCIPYSYRLTSVVPGIPLINFNDGGEGSDRGLYFIPKKITTSEFVNPKKSLLFLAYPPWNPLVLFPQPKNISLFCDPKNSWRISWTQKNHFGPKFQTQKITRTPPPPPSLKYVSGAPWSVVLRFSLRRQTSANNLENILEVLFNNL